MTTIRKVSWAYDEKESTRSLRTDSTDDEVNDDQHWTFEDENLNQAIGGGSYGEATDPIKYKTELCKNFSEKGFCHYNEKCQFAHGYHELSWNAQRLTKMSKKSYRTKRCKNFWQTGQCLYGLRCQFGHYEISRETLNMLKIFKAICETTEQRAVVSYESKLLYRLYSSDNGIFCSKDQ